MLKRTLIVIAVALGGCNDKPIEPTIELTQSDLMVIYYNGYVSGQLNQAKYVDKCTSEKVWRADSIEISDRFFK